MFLSYLVCLFQLQCKEFTCSVNVICVFCIIALYIFRLCWPSLSPRKYVSQEGKPTFWIQQRDTAMATRECFLILIWILYEPNKIIGSIGLYKTTTLCLVLYRGTTWSMILKEEHRLRVFGGRVQMRIFRSKRNKVTRDWSRLMRKSVSCTLFHKSKSRRRWTWNVGQVEGEGDGIRGVHIWYWRISWK
jgi:hypothetical protein